MKYYSQTGRRNHGRPLKRLLDTWDRTGQQVAQLHERYIIIIIIIIMMLMMIYFYVFQVTSFPQVPPPKLFMNISPPHVPRVPNPPPSRLFFPTLYPK